MESNRNKSSVTRAQIVAGADALLALGYYGATVGPREIAERVATIVLEATAAPPEKHDYEGNWPYEPCHVCGRTYPGDFDVHNYIVRQGNGG